MSVILVRHAESAFHPATPSRTWGLTDAGREAARRLRIDGWTRLLAGPEPRMAATLEHLGTVEIDDRYAESESEGWLSEEDFARAVERYFEGEVPAPGWERARDVVARFTLVDGAVIASGGRAIAAVVAHHTGCDGLTLWRSLHTPHVIALGRDEEGRWVASTPP